MRQGVQTAADVAFSGESLGEALKHNAPMVMIDAVQGYVAQRIGEWHHGTEEEFIAAQDERLEQSNGDIESIIFTAQETSLLDSITHKLMHSVLGAGIAAIQHEDIAAGAIAAPLGEMISETYGKYQKSQIQQDYKDGKISVREVSERLSNAKVSAVEVAKVGTAVAALFTGRDVNTATNAAGNAAENNFVPVLVAGAVIAMQIATVVDVATNCYEFKVAMDKGDVDGAIAAGVAVGMAAVPGQKLIPAPLRKAVHGVVTKSVTRILHSKYGQA
ncbi:MAG: hypothetical protein KBF71_08960, partial [Alphaproteobacteria bacterium]|nr:hypothetical protein [Alphaproteobacteria bacterium]